MYGYTEIYANYPYFIAYKKQEDEIDQRFAHLKKAVATYESRLGLDISILSSMNYSLS